MLLQRPDPVVPHHADHADPVARERVELHPREAERAVAEQQHDLPLRMRELGCQRVAGAGAQASERAGIEPAARLVRRHDAPRVGDEVAAVADHDGVAVEDRSQLAVDPHRVQRRAVVLELLALGGPLLGLDLAQVGEPAARVRAAGAGQRAERLGDVAVALGRHLARVIALGLGEVDRHDLGLLAEGAAEAEPEVHRDADHQRHVGALERGAARAGEEVRVVGRQAAPGQPVEEDRDADGLGERAQRVLTVTPVEVRAGHDHGTVGVAQECRGAVDRSRVGGRAGSRRGCRAASPPPP